MTKTHWLYGRGPDHILDFKREIDEETDCGKCTRREVCDRDMEKRCENYVFGTSEGRGCQGCLHKYTRYDNDAVPCFSCPWFEKKKEAVLSTYLPMDCPACGRRRLELIDGGKIIRCEKCTTSSEWDGFTVERYATAAAEIKACAVAAEAAKNPSNDQPNVELVGRRFRSLHDRPERVAVVLRVDLSCKFSCGVRLMYRYEGSPSASRCYISQRRFLARFGPIDKTSASAP